MKTVNGHIQVYAIWVNGRDIEDEDQHFPIDSNVDLDFEWISDFKTAANSYLSCEAKEENENGFYCDIYKDYHVALYSIDINVEEFENMFDLDFDIENDDVQESIPYYVDYDFNTVAEKIKEFKTK